MSEIDSFLSVYSEQFRLDLNLLKAISIRESNKHNFKVRFEPHIAEARLWYPRQWAEKLIISYDTECVLQKLSWGPMQILGSTARWMGYEDDLTKLVCPEFSLLYSAKYMRWLSDRTHGDESRLIASWNGGLGVKKTSGGMWANQRYVDGVYKELLKLRGELK